MRVSQGSHTEVVRLSAARASDRDLTLYLEEADTLETFVRRAREKGYQIDSAAIITMDGFFEQEIDNISRMQEIISIIGVDKFPNNILAKLKNTKATLHEFRELTSRIIPERPPLEKTLITLPEHLAKSLSPADKEKIAKLGGVFQPEPPLPNLKYVSIFFCGFFFFVGITYFLEGNFIFGALALVVALIVLDESIWFS